MDALLNSNACLLDEIWVAEKICSDERFPLDLAPKPLWYIWVYVCVCMRARERIYIYVYLFVSMLVFMCLCACFIVDLLQLTYAIPEMRCYFSHGIHCGHLSKLHFIFSYNPNKFPVYFIWMAWTFWLSLKRAKENWNGDKKMNVMKKNRTDAIEH